MANPELASGPRSIIEELNAHRERRPASDAMRELDRTLAGLEKRLRELEPATAQDEPALSRPATQDAAAGLAEIADNLRRRLEEAERETAREAQQHSYSDTTAQALRGQLDELNRSFRVPPRAETPRAFDPAVLRQIDGRLDDISRAIAAGHSRNPDREDALFRKLGDLSQRIDTLSDTAALPAQVMDQLAHQVGLLASQVARVTEKLSQTDYRGIEARLEAIGQKLEAAERRAQDNPHPAVLDTIDRRFAELTERLDAQLARRPAAGDALQALETRFDDLSQQISLGLLQGSHPGESEAIRNLEGQIANIARHLAEPVAELARLSPRLDSIERSIETNRATVLEAAREAAESAVARMVQHGAQGDTAIARQLAEDVKSLEALAQSADERNGKTFQTVHGTLVNIADRLARLERDMDRTDRTDRADPAPAREPEKPALPPLRSPAVAAAEAAQAAVESDGASAPKEPASRRSIFGFGKAARAGKPEMSASTALGDRIAEAPSFENERAFENELAFESDQTFQNEQTFAEPPHVHEETRFGGETTPDLHSIMKRVREERRQREETADVALASGGKADFIAAARQAAQLAASQSGELEKDTDAKAASGGFFQRQRKPILLAIGAVMMAMAGLQVGSAYLEREEPADIAPQAALPIPAAAPQEEAPAVPAAQPRQEQAEAAPAVTQPEPPAEPEPAPQAEASAPAAIPAVPEEAGPAALREAAAKGDARALFEVGNRYMEGRGVTADFATAAQWYDIAAAKGFAPAQYRLGNFNEKGLGMPRDLEKARHWYELAAKQGNASAMHNLAVLFATGANGAPDNKTAVRWFTEAAEFGIKDSQFNLGILAAKGLGMATDLEESYKWFALAANAGDSDAADKRDQIAKALKPEQLARAKATVELWKAKPLDAAANATDVPDAWTEAQPVVTGSVDMKKAVRNIQLILRKNGYDVGSTDGVMGARTRTAIASFQKANGLEPTGEVDQKLVRLLLEKNA